MMAGDAYADHDLVVAQLDGNPIDPSSDGDDWQELERVAEVEGRFRMHDGRHFAATFLLAQGVDLRTVQELMGQSSVKVTEGYTHVASEMARDATKRVGERLFGEGGTPLIMVLAEKLLLGRTRQREHRLSPSPVTHYPAV